MKRLVLLSATLLLLGSLCAQTVSYPQWWLDRGVVALEDFPPPQPGESEYEDWRAANYAPVNQGQLLNLASAAIAELDAELGWIGGAGFALGDLRDPTVPPSYFSPVNLGQLKAVAAPFYDRFAAIGFGPGQPGWPTNLILDEGPDDIALIYPWRNNQTPANFSPANLGQAKHLFSWTIADYGATLLTDDDGDGITLLDERVLTGTDPDVGSDILAFPLSVNAFRDGYSDSIPALFVSLPGDAHDGVRIYGDGFRHLASTTDYGTIYVEPLILNAREGDRYLVSFDVSASTIGGGNGLDVWIGEGIPYASARSRVLAARTPGGRQTHGNQHNNHIVAEPGNYAFILEIDEPVPGQDLQLNLYSSLEDTALDLENLQIRKVYYGQDNLDRPYLANGLDPTNGATTFTFDPDRDEDGDGVVNEEDAAVFDRTVGRITISITSP